MDDLYRMKKDVVLAALITERSQRKAAKKAGVDESTIRRWKREHPEFKAEYDALTNAALEDALASIKLSAEIAQEALDEIAGDKDASKQARVNAAGKIMDIAIGSKFEEILKRLEALENKDD